MSSTVLTLNAEIARFLVATLLPLVVAIVTKFLAPSWFKAVTLIVLGAIATVITVSIGADGVAVISRETLVESFNTLIIAIAMYFGLWRNTAAKQLGMATKDFGLGKADLSKAA